MNILDKVMSMCKENNVKLLFLAESGSYLYGMNTETSDRDYVGIFLPSKESLLVEESPQHISFQTNPPDSGEKSTEIDVEIKLWSVSKYVKLFNNGDSGAVSLRFSPPLYKDRGFVEDLNEKLLPPKKISGMIGFAKAQAYKYSEKGNKYTSLKNIVEILEQHRGKTFGEIGNLIENFPHVLVLESLPVKYQILHTTFDANSNVGWALDNCLVSLLNKYGKRTKESSDNHGVDYKSCSHSVRIFHEIAQLHTFGRLEYPHSKEFVDKILLPIKKGEMNMSQISEILDAYENFALEAESKSVLLDDAIKINQKKFKNYMLKVFNKEK